MVRFPMNLIEREVLSERNYEKLWIFVGKKVLEKRNCSKNSGNIGKTLVRIIYDDLIRFYIFIIIIFIIIIFIH